MVKKLLFLFLLSGASFLAYSQVIDDENGKTYYYFDSLTHKRVKEIFHHKQMVKVMPDPHHYGSYIDTFIYIKNGPYTRYFENGNLECSGYFRNEKKDSLWKFYNVQGLLVKTERWRNGSQVQ